MDLKPCGDQADDVGSDGIATLATIHNQFLGEARQAPTLFSDLASLETYIAETYRARTLIELLQNADDAQAVRMGVHWIQDGLFVGNDGRPFNVQDIKSLCRSGSSYKKRGRETIGYRGVGFKSTANLAKSVCVSSGPFCFRFDREMTRKLVSEGSAVPLLRIPHPVGQMDNDPMALAMRDLMREHRYTTGFLFSRLEQRTLEEEFKKFDPSSLLFLRRLRFVLLEQPGKRIECKVVRSPGPICNSELCELQCESGSQNWMTLGSGDSGTNHFAFRVSDEGSVVPASPDESILHAFTPTAENAGSALKINGDFSTDPSRKSVDLDSLSLAAFSSAADVLVSAIRELLDSSVSISGFFRPFTEFHTGSRFRPVFLARIRERIDEGGGLRLGCATTAPVRNVKLRPDWLNYEDFESLCGSDIPFVPKHLHLRYPDLHPFLQALGATFMDLDLAMDRAKVSKMTRSGTAELFAKVARHFRYTLKAEDVDFLRDVPLFVIRDRLVTPNDCGPEIEVDQSFASHLLTLTDAPDVQHLLRKLGILIISPEALCSPGHRTTGSGASSASRPNEEQNTYSFSSGASVRELTTERSNSMTAAVGALQSKWRSAELYVTHYLSGMESVLMAKDVSSSNLGYDVEVTLKNGKRMYIEVKSVTSFSDTLRLTSNEYATAHAHGDQYALAVVVSGRAPSVGFIRDPLKKMALQRQVERWAWLLENYSNELATWEHLR